MHFSVSLIEYLAMDLITCLENSNKTKVAWQLRDGTVNLNCTNNDSMSPTGLFCCMVNNYYATVTVCVNIGEYSWIELHISVSGIESSNPSTIRIMWKMATTVFPFTETLMLGSMTSVKSHMYRRQTQIVYNTNQLLWHCDSKWVRPIFQWKSTTHYNSLYFKPFLHPYNYSESVHLGGVWT